jgi:hypothetical protein
LPPFLQVEQAGIEHAHLQNVARGQEARLML